MELSSTSSKKNGLPFELPKLGEPGGIDDPLRNGLSGAGARRYLRLLHQGIKTEKARRQVLQRPSPKVIPTGKQSKSGPEHIISPTEPLTKKQKIAATKASQVIRYAAAVKAEKTFRIAIISKDYPRAVLKVEQLPSLEDILMKQLCQSQERRIHFSGVHFKNGMKLVDCGSQKSAEWLMTSVSELKSWKGPDLEVLREDDIPKLTKITVFYPRIEELDSEKIFRLVKVQNSKLSTGVWRLLNYTKKGRGTHHRDRSPITRSPKGREIQPELPVRRITVSGL